MVGERRSGVVWRGDRIEGGVGGVSLGFFGVGVLVMEGVGVFGGWLRGDLRGDL